jgi:endonuclease G, mitochondrial
MAPVAGRLFEAQIAIMQRAATRFRARTAVREAGLAKIERSGLGAADSVKRQMEYAARMQQAHSRLGIRTTEAILGTNDLVAFAPSEASRAAARPVARIVKLRERGYEPQGIATGFLIAESGLLLTNHHVFARDADARGCGANFRHVEDENGVADGQYFELDPDRFFLSHEKLDFAIVAVKQTGIAGEGLASVGFTRLIEATGKIVTGEPVNIVQHPGGGPRRYAVKNNLLVDILPEGYLHYEADTEPGSSGSPVFSPRWELVALHHCAVPEMEPGGGARPMTTRGVPFDRERDTLADIHWIANEGTRASFIVEALRGMTFTDPSKAALLSSLIASTRDPLATPPAESVGEERTTRAPGSTGMGGATFSISGPTTIHVYSAPSEAAITVERAAASPGPMVFEEKVLVFDSDYPSRGGYDPEFLGVTVPAPHVTGAAAQELYTVGDYRAFFAEFRDVPEIDTTGRADADPFILAFHHYSLAFNTTHFMCAWTASNCDYRPAMREDTRKRSEFGGENWRLDPRVPPTLQLADKDVYAPARRVDRGHIVRREDNAWGEAGDDTEYANSDTYHYTNCTPQHEAFNQENPQNRDKTPDFTYKDLGIHGVWGAFEAAVEKQLKAGGGKAVIFSGPVLSDFVDVRDWATGMVETPKRFFKVVVVPESMKKNPKLLSYGYIFDQTDVVKRFGLTYEERLDLPAFEKHRRTLREITALTGVAFAKGVTDAEEPIA